MMKIEKQDIEPLCPHCGTQVDRLIMVSKGPFVALRVFCCPHCRKIVGVASTAH
jgi:hypothetical protein